MSKGSSQPKRSVRGSHPANQTVPPSASRAAIVSPDRAVTASSGLASPSSSIEGIGGSPGGISGTSKTPGINGGNQGDFADAMPEMAAGSRRKSSGTAGTGRIGSVFRAAVATFRTEDRTRRAPSSRGRRTNTKRSGAPAPLPARLVPDIRWSLLATEPLASRPKRPGTGWGTGSGPNLGRGCRRLRDTGGRTALRVDGERVAFFMGRSGAAGVGFHRTAYGETGTQDGPAQPVSRPDFPSNAPRAPAMPRAGH